MRSARLEQSTGADLVLCAQGAKDWRSRLSHSLPRPQPEANKNIAAHRVAAIIRLNGSGKRVSGKIRADAGLDTAEQIDVPRVPDRVAADAKRAAVQARELRFQIRLIGEQLVL